MNFGWAFLKVVDEHENKAEEYPSSSNFYLRLAAKFSHELEEYEDAVRYFKRAGEFHEAAQAALKSDNPELALCCYEQADDLDKHVFTAVELALQTGDQQRAKDIFNKTTQKKIGKGFLDFKIKGARQAMELGLQDTAERLYQEIQNKGYLISLGHEEITEIAQIAQSLGHSRSAQAYNTLVELKKITPTRLQNEPPHFYNLTNPDESFDVRSIEREIREQLHFYETKVKPLMV